MAAESTPRPTAEEMASSLRPGETIEDVWKDIYNPEGYDYELGESGSDLEPEQYEEQGRSLDAHVTSPWDPLDFVEGTDHPLARFPGNPLTWESSLFDDGTSYEGLTREMVPQGTGVMTMGNMGAGAGIQNCERGDRYEGEFYIGFAHGLGQYTSTEGKVYRGEFMLGKKHGCGSEVDMKPYYDAVKSGMDAEEAWTNTQQQISASTKYGTWRRDLLVHKASPTDDDNRYCDYHEIKYKPDGDVTYMTAQDEYGTPVPTWQDPLHYPHDTKFLAPGPLGQCHPVPDDWTLRSQMAKHARNYKRVFDMYNLDLDPPKDSDMGKALAAHRSRMKRAQALVDRSRQEEGRRVDRLGRAAGEPPEEPMRLPPPPSGRVESMDSGDQEPSLEDERNDERDDERDNGRDDERDDEGDDDVDEDVEESDLVAELPPGHSSSGPGQAVFGSLSLAWRTSPALHRGLHMARRLASGALGSFAEKAQRRRGLARPRRGTSTASADC